MADIVRFGSVAVLLVLALVAVGGAFTGAAEFRTATNESLTVDYNQTSTVGNASIAVSIFDNETVRNESGTILAEGTDYQFYTSNGSVRWYNTTPTAAGEDATITYNYTTQDQQTRDLGQVMRYGFFATILSLVAMAVVTASRWFPSTGGGR